MKIQLLSDTHGFDYDIAEEADVIVHAGDFSNSLRGMVDFANYCKELNKDFVFVLGNHDYFDSNIEDTLNFLRDNYPNNALLYDNAIKIKNKTFVGGTLFTNFRANKLQYEDPLAFDEAKRFAEEFVYDFSKVLVHDHNKKNRLVKAEDYVTLFNKYYNNILKYKNKKDVVVVTHFPPHLACLDPYWGNHPTASKLNPYFINDVSIKGFKHWLCGHTHTALDTEADGCRLVINPLGYPQEHDKNGYRNNLIIEV